MMWKDGLHSVGTSSSPKAMEWDQDNPGKSATEFSVLRAGEKPGGNCLTWTCRAW